MGAPFPASVLFDEVVQPSSGFGSALLIGLGSVACLAVALGGDLTRQTSRPRQQAGIDAHHHRRVDDAEFLGEPNFPTVSARPYVLDERVDEREDLSRPIFRHQIENPRRDHMAAVVR